MPTLAAMKVMCRTMLLMNLPDAVSGPSGRRKLDMQRRYNSESGSAADVDSVDVDLVCDGADLPCQM